MFRRTRYRIASAADLLRPRQFFRTLLRVDTLAETVRQLTAAVNALRIQTEQLMAIQRLDWDQRDAVSHLEAELDAPRIDAHIAAAVSAAELELDPFPHVVVNEWLPWDTYRHVINAIPHPVFFAGREEGRDRLSVPFSVAPVY